MNIEKQRGFIVSFTYFLIIGAIVYVVLKYGLPLLAPFALGFLFAYILKRPIRFLHEKLRLKKRLAQRRRRSPQSRPISSVRSAEAL